MTNEEYFAKLQALRDRQEALDQEKAQLNQDYFDSLPFKEGDEVYYTRYYGFSSSELRGFIFRVDASPFADADFAKGVFVHYAVCPPTKAGKMPKVAKNATYGTEEQLKLRKFQDSDR
jgi:hypothetical protein